MSTHDTNPQNQLFGFERIRGVNLLLTTTGRPIIVIYVFPGD